jgi:soluble lytic murein transglycosylase-like protein
MKASGVIYASYINEASDRFGVSPALLQAMIDDNSGSVLDLPDPAIEFANIEMLKEKGGRSLSVQAHLVPKYNILAAAWYLSSVNEMFGSEPYAVSQFYGEGPRGKVRAAKIISGPYKRRVRQWS